MIDRETDIQTKVSSFLYEMNLDDPRGSFSKINEKIMINAMPWISALDKIHSVAKSFGIDNS